MAKNKKGGLGRGIEALFAENEVTELADETVQDIKLSLIHPNPYQPRRTFDKEALAELASSIEKSGVFQPIILRQTDPKINRYELIAGERRFRASKIAKQKTIPAIVRKMSDDQMMEIAVLENLQREDLTPLEEAQAYQMLMDKLSLTQAQVASRLGKSRPYIANYLRLLGLPKVIKEFLNTGKLSMGQARTILGLKDKSKLVPLAQRAVEQNLTVRQLEEIVTKTNGTAKKTSFLFYLSKHHLPSIGLPSAKHSHADDNDADCRNSGKSLLHGCLSPFFRIKTPYRLQPVPLHP